MKRGVEIPDIILHEMPPHTGARLETSLPGMAAGP